MISPTARDKPPAQRSPLRAVAVPSEHGGWGLTGEPVLLGLLVAPSVAGVAIGVAAFVAFMARTPLKVILVDRWRHRRMSRTRLAVRVLSVEVVVIVALVGIAAARTSAGWWAPLLAAVPLVVVELAYDMRSRSRRLLPELCGAVGIAAVASSIAHAGGAGWTLSLGLWVVLAARSVSSIPYTRAQVQRLHHHQPAVGLVDLAQAIALVAIIAAYGAGLVPGTALVAVGVVVVIQALWLRLRPPPVVVLGVSQLLAGLAIVLATVAGTAW
jgi:hypothetical protein